MQGEVGLESDYLTLSAELTGCKTQLVTLHTDCDKQLANTERQRSDKKKRLAELKRFQNILIELEQWLKEAQSSIKQELKLTSVEVVEKQIKASQVSCSKSLVLKHFQPCTLGFGKGSKLKVLTVEEDVSRSWKSVFRTF